MTSKVFEITELYIKAETENSSTLLINANGNVSTSGWSGGKLAPFVYKKPPEDGIYEFDFIAIKPTGLTPQVITPIQAIEYKWEGFPKDLVGVKVYASSNHLSEQLLQNIDKSQTGKLPFEKLSVEECELLRAENHSFVITNAFIWEDMLHITVEYSGGCKKHLFQLIWDGSERESLPPQIDLFLIHNNQGDVCKANITEELQFTLSELLYTDYTIFLEGWEKQLDFKAAGPASNPA